MPGPLLWSGLFPCRAWGGPGPSARPDGAAGARFAADADAALRAEVSPGGLGAGLSGEEWTGLAASAWERCRRHWDRAGDPARAYLAAKRLAALGSAAPVATAPSPWAAALGERGSPREPPFLAEAIGL